METRHAIERLTPCSLLDATWLSAFARPEHRSTRTIRPCSRATTNSRARFVGPRGPILHGTAGATASATRRVVARSSLSRARRPFRLSGSRPQGASPPATLPPSSSSPAAQLSPAAPKARVFMLFKCRVNREPRAGRLPRRHRRSAHSRASAHWSSESSSTWVRVLLYARCGEAPHSTRREDAAARIRQRRRRRVELRVSVVVARLREVNSGQPLSR